MFATVCCRRSIFFFTFCSCCFFFVPLCHRENDFALREETSPEEHLLRMPLWEVEIMVNHSPHNA